MFSGAAAPKGVDREASRRARAAMKDRQLDLTVCEC